MRLVAFAVGTVFAVLATTLAVLGFAALEGSWWFSSSDLSILLFVLAGANGCIAWALIQGARDSAQAELRH